MSETFGKYSIEKELGRGAAGIVYLARDPDLTRRVAIKKLVVPHTFGPAERATLFERFRREARAAAARSPSSSADRLNGDNVASGVRFRRAVWSGG